jgi:hypothetical protein
MASTQATEGDGFKIWGVDGVVYGPVELPILVGWVKEERVTATTWVYTERDDAWHKASDIPELFMFFRPKESSEPTTQVVRDPSVAGLKAGSLRRVKIFADLTEEQLERFVTFMEIERVRQWAEIVKQGEQGDAMFLVVEGELRVRMMIGGKESILVTLGPGEFFGEISLFDRGPRSADVVANTDSMLLKISAKKFERLISQAPDLAAPFLFAMGKTLTARIRADNKRYRDSINFARAAGK